MFRNDFRGSITHLIVHRLRQFLLVACYLWVGTGRVCRFSHLLSGDDRVKNYGLWFVLLQHGSLIFAVFPFRRVSLALQFWDTRLGLLSNLWLHLIWSERLILERFRLVDKFGGKFFGFSFLVPIVREWSHLFSTYLLGCLLRRILVMLEVDELFGGGFVAKSILTRDWNYSWAICRRW